MKVLFVCAANLNRSPTFEAWFKEKYPAHEFRAAGIYYGYPHILNEEQLVWADWVFVMDLEQHRYIVERWSPLAHKVCVVGVSDQYDVGSAALKDIIEYWADMVSPEWQDHYPDCQGTMCSCAKVKP